MVVSWYVLTVFLLVSSVEWGYSCLRDVLKKIMNFNKVYLPIPKSSFEYAFGSQWPSCVNQDLKKGEGSLALAFKDQLTWDVPENMPTLCQYLLPAVNTGHSEFSCPAWSQSFCDLEAYGTPPGKQTSVEWSAQPRASGFALSHPGRPPACIWRIRVCVFHKCSSRPHSLLLWSEA